MYLGCVFNTSELSSSIIIDCCSPLITSILKKRTIFQTNCSCIKLNSLKLQFVFVVDFPYFLPLVWIWNCFFFSKNHIMQMWWLLFLVYISFIIFTFTFCKRLWYVLCMNNVCFFAFWFLFGCRFGQ